MIKLNIGCGKDIKKDYVNLDQHLENGADKIYVLPNITVKSTEYINGIYRYNYYLQIEGDVLPYKKETIDEIYCSHVLEDFLYEFEAIILDFHRVLKKGGLLHIKVPYKASYGSIYHKRFFDKNTFKCLVNENFHYQNQPLFKELRMNKVNRYGIFSCVLLFLVSRLGNTKQQLAYSKIYDNYTKPGFLGRLLKLLYKLDPKIGYAYELEIKVIK